MFIDLTEADELENESQVLLPQSEAASMASAALEARLRVSSGRDEVDQMLLKFRTMAAVYGTHVPADLEDLWKRIVADRLTSRPLYDLGLRAHRSQVWSSA